MSGLMIIYLLGCASAMILSIIDTYHSYWENYEDIEVGDVLVILCSSASSWFYVVGSVLSHFPKIIELTIIKNRRKEEWHGL